MKNRLATLIERADEIASERTPRRRIDLVEKAVAAGHDVEYADQIYDIAEEEGLDPAFAFELVLNEIGVRELAPPNEDQWLETQVEAPPTWVAEPEQKPESAERERHMRNTFRRLRRMLEEHSEPRSALEAFARAPDVAEIRY
jgi:hypothetical protein